MAHSAASSALLLLATISGFFLVGIDALKCWDCSSMDSSCKTDPIPTCDGEYCSFLNLSNTLGQIVNYKCSKNPKLMLEEMEFTETNKCINGSNEAGLYMLKICNNTDLCNAECRLDTAGNGASVHFLDLIPTALFVAVSLAAFKY